MAVVNENSAQAVAKMGGRKLAAYRDQAQFLNLEINHTEVVAGDATSVQRLCWIPPGLYRLKRDLSFIRFSAFGASRTLHIGWEAYQDKDGVAVAVSAAGLNSGIDVSAAGVANVGTVLTVGYKDFESKAGVWIFSTTNVGTIPVGATIDGSLVLTCS
jgi:hypothetical protein